MWCYAAMVMVAMLPEDALAKLISELTELLDNMDESNVVQIQFRHDDEWKEAA